LSRWRVEGESGPGACVDWHVGWWTELQHVPKPKKRPTNASEHASPPVPDSLEYSDSASSSFHFSSPQNSSSFSCSSPTSVCIRFPCVARFSRPNARLSCSGTSSSSSSSESSSESSSSSSSLPLPSSSSSSLHSCREEYVDGAAEALSDRSTDGELGRRRPTHIHTHTSKQASLCILALPPPPPPPPPHHHHHHHRRPRPPPWTAAACPSLAGSSS
jgi:hypothetical protein